VFDTRPHFHAEADAEVGDAPPDNIRSSDTRSFMETTVDSQRNQSFHWHGNARSYFPNGKLLGDDIVDLLSP
jgi:hypothetical protein